MVFVVLKIGLAYDVGSICIMPYALKRCADLLAGSTVKASTTIGFPHGGHSTAIKVAEAERALAAMGRYALWRVGRHRAGTVGEA